MENTDKKWLEELRHLAEEAKRTSLDDEKRRIENDVTFAAHTIVQKYFTEQEVSLKETLQRAATERLTALERIRQRKGEVMRLLAVERKKKEDARKKIEEDKRRQEEQERKRKAEEEKKRRQQEEKERKEKVQAAIEKIRAFYTDDDWDTALVEVERALEIDPANEDIKIWDHRIKESQQKKKRDEETARLREEEAANRERKRKTKKNRYLVIAAVLIVAVVLIYEFQKDLFPQTVTLAIEPFSSSNKSAEGVSIGSSLALALADKMSSFPNVTVMGYTSSLNIERSQKNTGRIMNKLGFSFILSGSVATKGNLYTADVHVLDSTNKEIWSGHFEQPSTSFMQLTEEIALQLAKAMDVKLTDKSEQAIKRSGTINATAYLQYLNGLESLDEQTPESVQQAYRLFSQATTTDSRFADAYAGAAYALLTKIENRWDTNDSLSRRADELIKRALSIQPSLPMAKIAQARLATIQQKFSDALKSVDEVLQQSPHNADALLYKGKVLTYIGNFDEALTTLNAAYDVNPRDPDILLMLGYVNSFKGKLRDAMKYQEYAIPLVADSTRFLAENVIDFVMSDPDLQISSGERIASACEQLLQQNPHDLSLLYRDAQILQVLGKIPEADRPLNTMRSILQNQLIYSPRNADAMMDLALMLTRYGSFPEGIDMARRAVSIDRTNPVVMYKLAQMYSVQMASHKGGKIDTTKKSEALKYLQEAVTLEYRFDELASGDFYNLRTQPEFLTTIKLEPK